MEKYRVFCDLTQYEFLTDDLDKARREAENYQCGLYDNITGKLIKDYNDF